MYYRDGKPVYAPTDLSRWLMSPYASWMSRYVMENRDDAPLKDIPDAMLSRLATRGLAHEDAMEKLFVEQGLNVVNVAESLAENKVGESDAASGKTYCAALALTKELLESGVDVVAQATLESGRFRGHADFLVKVPGVSALGDFHYEVWDTKLARRVKPGMVLQLCCYVDMLEGDANAVLNTQLNQTLDNVLTEEFTVHS